MCALLLCKRTYRRRDKKIVCTLPLFTKTLRRSLGMQPAYKPKETTGARGCNLVTCAYEVQINVTVGCADRAGETREAVGGPDMITISMCMEHVCNKTAQIKDVVSRT